MSSINSIIPSMPQQQSTAAKAATTPATKSVEEQVAAVTTPRQDVYTKSGSIDKDRIQSMKTELNNNLGAFQKMVETAVNKQGGYRFTSLAELFENIEVDEATILEAQENIAEDGYWGVEQTAQRILDFAAALSGGNANKIDQLEAAVLKGFEAAEKAWGGKLADISYQTKDRIMQGFDTWRNSGAAPVSQPE